MKNIFLLFCLSVSLIVLTASNCTKKDPVTDPPETSTTSVNVPLIVGMIVVYVHPNSISNPPLTSAKVNIALSLDSLKNKQYTYSERVTNDSGIVKYDHLQLNKTYYFHATWTDLSTGQTLFSKDTFAKANPVQIPTELKLIVK